MSQLLEDSLKESVIKRGVTKAELDALLLALDGCSGADIAQRLKISEAAVRKRLGEIYRKFQITERNNKKLGKLREVLLAEHQSRQQKPEKSRQDWGEAVDVDDFSGRKEQLNQLEQWILSDDRCRLVAILGMGGIGKTALAARLARKLEDKFEYIIWRSLRNAPSVRDILADLLQFLPNEQKPDLPDNENNRILRLIDALRKYRCLVILDNVESVLRSGEGEFHARAGEYREGYELYGYLFKRVGETSHQSCLLLTSREKPKEIAALEGKELPIKVLPLPGLNQEEAQAIRRYKGFSGSDAEWNELVERYSGNPLALKIVETTIHDLFGDNVAEFLNQIKQATAVYGDIRELIDQQFNRLSELEKHVIYWLTIHREFVSLAELQDDNIISSEPRIKLLEAVESLWRRSLVEKDETSGKLRQQSVVMEYMTEHLVEQFIWEFMENNIDNLFNKFPLMKGQALDYIRKEQDRLILEPVKNKLLESLGDKFESRLYQILTILREQSPRKKGYAGGNVINLLRQMRVDSPEIDLSGNNFSNITIWQAYLKDVKLQGTTFINTDLTGSVFNETLASFISVAFSPDGKRFATGMDSISKGEIRLWQVIDSKQIHIYTGHTKSVWSVDFSPIEQIMASGSADGTVRLWETANRYEFIKTLDDRKQPVRSISFSPDGQTLGSGSEDKTIKLWQVSTGECLQTLQGHESTVLSVDYSPDGKTIVSSSEDKTVRLWNIFTGKCLHIFQEHEGQVYSVRFSPDGQTVASGSEDKTVKLWNANTGECLQTLAGHTEKVYSVRFSPDVKGRKTPPLLASGSEDKTVKLWNVKTGECFQTLEGHNSQIWSVAFSYDGRTLISSSDDQTVRLWNIKTGRCLNILQGRTSGVFSVAFSPDGQILATGSDDHFVRLWDIKTGECLNTLKEHKGRIRSVAFSPDGQTLASGSADYTIKLWQVNTGKCIHTLKRHKNWVWSVAFSPDGQTLASGSEDRTLRLWNVRTGERLQKFVEHTDCVWTVAFSPDGSILASGSADSTVKLWDISTGQCFQTLKAHTSQVCTVAFSPDGKILASGSGDKTVKLWDVNTGKCLQTLERHGEEVFSVAFSPDGKTLASGSGDKTVKRWKVSTGEYQDTLEWGHNAPIRAVAFSQDGNTLASGSEDETVQLWSVPTGRRLQQLKSKKLYEGMNISGVTGLTDAQRDSLKVLGAID